jgi:two-component system response regulator MprA
LSDDDEMTAGRALVVEDDSELRGVVLRVLREEGFDAAGAATAADALRSVDDNRPDILIVDIGLPDADGRDLCQAVRARGIQLPVLFLTARDAVTDRLAGFSAGGDDYVTKPFDLDELVARIRALLRRANFDGVQEVGGLRLDPVAHGASCADHTVSLSPTEFRILAALAGRQGEAVRRRELLGAGWPHGAIVHDNTLDVYMARLRRKLRSMPGAPAITTVHGVGYSLG